MYSSHWKDISYLLKAFKTFYAIPYFCGKQSFIPIKSLKYRKRSARLTRFQWVYCTLMFVSLIAALRCETLGLQLMSLGIAMFYLGVSYVGAIHTRQDSVDEVITLLNDVVTLERYSIPPGNFQFKFSRTSRRKQLHDIYVFLSVFSRTT
jgi:hypothetical protein